MRLRFVLTLLPVMMSLCGTATGKDTYYPDSGSPLIADDISNQNISSFAEDAHGHIWMGTFRGLNRFNVHEFHQYFCTDEPNSLPDNQIQHLLRDSHDRLWISTVNGMALYTDKDDFKRIPMETQSRNSFYIIEDRQGRIFINNFLALCMYDEAAEKFVEVISLLHQPQSLVRQCFITPDNYLLVATSFDIRRYCLDDMQMKDCVTVPGYPTYFSMMEDGRLWVSSYEGLSVYDPRTQIFSKAPEAITSHPAFQGASITHIYPYGKENILFNTDRNGLFIYDRTSGTFSHQSENGFPFIVPDVKIKCLYEDSRHNLWIGSHDQGYHVIYDYQAQFNNDNWLKSNIGHRSVVSVDCDSRDNLWISTLKDGIFLYSTSSRLFRKIDLTGIIRSDTPVSNIFVDRDDNVWLVTAAGLTRCRFDGDRLQYDKSWPVLFPMSLSQDRCGRIWIGGGGESVHYITPEDDCLHHLKTVSSSFTFIPFCLPLNDGNILTGAFQNGLCEISSDEMHVRRITFDPDTWKNSIKRSVFVPSCMYQDRNGTVWAGTIANGLLRYDISSEALSPVPGTPCLDIASIEEDMSGNLWVSTQYGLGKYDRESGVFINWFASDGIGGNQFYDRASCRLSDGTLVFGGTHGLTVFNPNEVTEYRNIPVLFETLKVHNGLMRPGIDKCIDKALPHNPDIRLEHGQNSFSISFTAIEYSEWERVDYMYMLEGLDECWIDAHNNREAYYSNVPAGKYDFRIRVTNGGKTAVMGENSIRITVAPPLWRTWWANLLYALGLASVIAMIAKVHRKMNAEKTARLKAQQEKEHEKKVNDMNMNFFANISHEFRTPLTMISGPVTQLQESGSMSMEDKRLLNIVQRNIRRMLRLVNQLLDFNRLENDALMLQVKPIDLVAQLRNLTDIFAVTANEKGCTFRIYGLEDSLTVWADEDKLDKICFNLLSNAMKFTQAGGEVEFGLDVISREEAARLFDIGEKDVDTHYMKIAVKDNGPGIPEDSMERIFERYYQLDNQTRGEYNWGTGIGLYLAKTLAHMHHGYLKAGNRTEGPGAVFTLILPVSENSFSESEKWSGVGNSESPFMVSSIKYSDAAAVGQGEDRKKVLIVDDDADVIHYLKEMLSPYYEVSSRFDADSAYSLLKKEASDVVISDIMMPGKNGYDLCRDIKNNIQLSHIPVILLTAKATVGDHVQGLGCGADAYVTKPFEPEYLLALIRSQLSNREKIRAMLGHSTITDNLEDDALSPQDNAFISELYQLMEKELANSELNVARMTEMLHISRTKFYYKVKGLTGDNPNVFFKKYKLNRALQMLDESKWNVSEIADMTGFSTLSHFSTSFKKQFGMAPSEYMKHKER